MSAIRTLLVLLVFVFSINSFAEVKILRITPSGDRVRSQRQINFTFNKAMRPLGNMDVKASALPITIQPKLECKWRWVDTKNLACELDHDNGVKLATEYTIKLKKSMKSHDGESLDKDYSHSFSTQRPEVKYLSLLGVGEWSSPVRPRMRIYHNMKISEESLKKAIQISNGPRFYKWQFFDKEGYEKGKFRNTWFIELTEDLEREANYSFTVAPGILNDECPLGSSNTFAKSITTPAKFRIKEVSCSYMENGTYRTKKFSSLELNRAIAPEKGQPHCEPHMNKTVELTNPVVPKDVYQTIKWGPVSEGVNPFSDLYNFNGTYPTSTISMPSVLKSGISYQMDLSEIRNIFNEKLEGLSMFEIVLNPRSPSISSKYADAVV